MTVERSRPTDPSRDPARDVDLVRQRAGNARRTYGPPERSRPPTFADRLRTFVRRYGWRAYALPILAVVTVAALMTTTTTASGPKADAAGERGPAASAPPTATGHIPLKGDNAGTFSNENLTAASLPSGPAYTKAGKGTFRVLPGTTRVAGTSGRLFRYTVDVENGVTGVNLTQYASMVDRVMDDPRSWSGHGVRVQRVDSGQADFHVTLTSTMTVRKYCGYSIPVETSCYAADGSVPGLTANRVFYNVARWVRGASAYLGDIDAYRTYMINHENGHALGHNHAHQCLPGGLAPLMMQQTFGLRETRGGSRLCQANPWPYPPGVKGAPGAEQIDTARNNEYGRGD